MCHAALTQQIKVGFVSESRAYLIYTTQFIYTGLATAVSLLGMSNTQSKRPIF